MFNIMPCDGYLDMNEDKMLSLMMDVIVVTCHRLTTNTGDHYQRPSPPPPPPDPRSKDILSIVYNTTICMDIKVTTSTCFTHQHFSVAPARVDYVQ